VKEKKFPFRTSELFAARCPAKSPGNLLIKLSQLR
jgi:hypothetical protein